MRAAATSLGCTIWPVAFGKQLNDVEIAAVIAYERNSWSNKVTDVPQPAEIKAARK